MRDGNLGFWDGNVGFGERISGWKRIQDFQDLIYRRDFGMGIPGGNLGMDLGFRERILGREFRMRMDLGKGLDLQEGFQDGNLGFGEGFGAPGTAPHSREVSGFGNFPLPEGSKIWIQGLGRARNDPQKTWE